MICYFWIYQSLMLWLIKWLKWLGSIWFFRFWLGRLGWQLRSLGWHQLTKTFGGLRWYRRFRRFDDLLISVSFEDFDPDLPFRFPLGVLDSVGLDDLDTSALEDLGSADIENSSLLVLILLLTLANLLDLEDFGPRLFSDLLFILFTTPPSQSTP